MHAEVVGIAKPGHVDQAHELAAAGICRDPFVAGVFACRLPAETCFTAIAGLFLVVVVVVGFGLGERRPAPADERVRLVWLVPELSI
jgi:hypothetical protein